MPELPEVETIRRGLKQYLAGQVIESVDVRLPRIFSGDKKSIIGSEIIDVRRFGKGLVIDLANRYSIAIHIKMTGQFIYVGPNTPKGLKISEKVGGILPHKHTHVIFRLRAESLVQREKAVLYYNDIRQFGWMKIIKTKELTEISFFRKLGHELLSNLSFLEFSRILSSSRSPVKIVIMDQEKIAGAGNIYANDALFLAKIHPKKAANTLSEKEAKSLFNALEKVLKKGIEVGGASEWQYVNALGQTGYYQDFFQVYGKVGKKCVVCGSVIEKLTLGGRGTFYCPSCQILE